MSERKCSVSKKCGGCQLSNMDYARQLKFKQAMVVKLLRRYCHVNDIIGMSEPYHYRNKVQAAIRRAANGRTISGVYQSVNSGIVVTDDCFINDKKANEMIKYIRERIIKLNIRPYDPKSRRGYIRHIMVRKGHATGDYMAAIVSYSEDVPEIDTLAKNIAEKYKEVKTVVLCINKSDKLMLGRNEKILYGKGYIEDILCGRRFRISARSFYQVNPIQTEVLYNTALEAAKLSGRENILDAYCGTGTIGLCAANRAKTVLGIEINRDAISDAVVNARLNNIANADFINGDAAEFMSEAAENGERFDVVFADPPRAGCSRVFLESLITLAPKRVVYISCNPETLARDMYILTKGGYKAEMAQPVDMFPHTRHVETVVLLSRKNIDDHISFTWTDKDFGTKGSRATYPDIKAYVQDKYDIKVSTLAIAQTKAKCGIIDRENYNKPKSENSKQPVCTKEKEDAIMDAFRHFKLI